LLQATDNLSLLTVWIPSGPAHLLHPLPLRGGGHATVTVRSVGTRRFVLEPLSVFGWVMTFAVSGAVGYGQDVCFG